MSSSDLVRRAREMGGFSPEAELCSQMADEIERLREALKQASLYAWQGDTFKIMDIARAALGEKE